MASNEFPGTLKAFGNFLAKLARSNFALEQENDRRRATILTAGRRCPARWGCSADACPG